MSSDIFRGGDSWYYAELVLEIVVEGSEKTVIHVNLVLVAAADAESAFAASIQLGMESEISYKNPAGQEVTTRFVGLKDLQFVEEELTHGTEIAYSEYIMLNGKGISPQILGQELSSLVTPKESLAAFRRGGIKKSDIPDYSSAEIVAEAEALMRHKQGAQ